jgi:hypothetical protein
MSITGGGFKIIQNIFITILSVLTLSSYAIEKETIECWREWPCCHRG